MDSRIPDAMRECRLCPRECGADRYAKKGFCGETADIRIARADLHMWEEPCLSGKGGSGAVFFSGCSLKCVYCQNYEISALHKGYKVTAEQLCDIFLDLQDKGAENIDLVTPTHFAVQIVCALEKCRDRLKIPVIYNCGGYEKVGTLRMFEGLADIFLPDVKYYDGDLARKYSLAEDYCPRCMEALREMVRIAGKPRFDENGMLRSGVIARHLVLPGCRHDSIRLLRRLRENFSPDKLLISLMSQYTPVNKPYPYRELDRRITAFEYRTVKEELDSLGFDGYVQLRESSSEEYIPQFFGEYL